MPHLNSFLPLFFRYRVFIYSGQLDVIIGAPLTEAFMRVLPWSGLTEYV
jgi:vitellogenic carboxypeptidase-like protein